MGSSCFYCEFVAENFTRRRNSVFWKKYMWMIMIWTELIKMFQIKNFKNWIDFILILVCEDISVNDMSDNQGIFLY